jgi:Bacteriophage baseplate protein W
MTYVDFPYHFGGNGRTSETDLDDHVRDLIHQVLFTSPGERVNRPTFGSGLNQLVFTPNSVEMAAATQILVQGALQEWLGDLIAIEAVEVEAVESSLKVRVAYMIRRNQRKKVAEFQSGG